MRRTGTQENEALKRGKPNAWNWMSLTLLGKGRTGGMQMVRRQTGLKKYMFRIECSLTSRNFVQCQKWRNLNVWSLLFLKAFSCLGSIRKCFHSFCIVSIWASVNAANTTQEALGVKRRLIPARKASQGPGTWIVEERIQHKKTSKNTAVCWVHTKDGWSRGELSVLSDTDLQDVWHPTWKYHQLSTWSRMNSPTHCAFVQQIRHTFPFRHSYCCCCLPGACNAFTCIEHKGFRMYIYVQCIKNWVSRCYTSGITCRVTYSKNGCASSLGCTFSFEHWLAG